MLRSMTGFGKAEQTINEKTFLVEIKALNGKQFDVNLKFPPLLKPYEFDIRSLLQEKLQRGSVECNITIKQNGSAKPVVVNTDLLKAYFDQVQAFAKANDLVNENILSSILRLPDVVIAATDSLDEQDFKALKNVLSDACAQLNKHREQEGDTLEKDLSERIRNIMRLQEDVLALAPKREQRIREEIAQLLAKHVGKDNVDGNRMEQELVYYIEKIDLHEEQIRLAHHCEYFTDIMKSNDEGNGKKLSFILQEIGREINTTGSKAYDSSIQKAVVEMKDELEKAKEQVLNVL